MFSFHTYRMLLSLPKWGENKNFFSTIRHWRHIWNKLTNMLQTRTREKTAVWFVLDQWMLGSLQCKCWKCSVSHHFSLDDVERLNVWTKMKCTWWVSNVNINGHARSNINLVNLKWIRTMTLEDEGSATGQHLWEKKTLKSNSLITERAGRPKINRKCYRNKLLITGPWNICVLVIKKDMVIRDLTHRLLRSEAKTERRKRYRNYTHTVKNKTNSYKLYFLNENLHVA